MKRFLPEIVFIGFGLFLITLLIVSYCAYGTVEIHCQQSCLEAGYSEWIYNGGCYCETGDGRAIPIEEACNDS